MDYDIRAIVSLEDVSKLIKLHNMAWNNSTGIIDLLENSTEAFILMDKTHKRLAGYIFLEADKKRSFFEINDIVVDPEDRGKGYGHLLMSFVMKRHAYLKLNADSTNKKLIGFYTSLGFETEARLENYYSVSKDALRMSWRQL